MNQTKKRKLDLVVLSDIHLGIFGCRAKEVLNYLETINPKIIILNGDIIDIWQFNKRYFPKAHLKVVKKIMGYITEGKKVYYITGNHDEMLRKFNNFRMGSFEIVNKLVLDLNGQKTWFFHGDVFDITMKHSKWLAKLGGIGYDLLILINTVINWISYQLGYGKISLSKKIKNSVKSAVKFINNFEETTANMAIYNQYDTVVCGHIHQPEIKTIQNKEGQQVLYLNSGDWIENLTALEYKKGNWKLYEYAKDPVANDLAYRTKQSAKKEKKLHPKNQSNQQLFEELLKEFDLKK